MQTYDVRAAERDTKQEYRAGGDVAREVTMAEHAELSRFLASLYD
jgi:hypothetical protein